MKRISLLLLFALHFFLCKSQSSYLPIFSDSDTSSWVIIFNGFGEIAAHAEILSLDTCINGQDYYRFRTWYGGNDYGANEYFLREDSLNRKVFVYEADTSASILLNTEALLYDFSLSIGDTVMVRNFDPVFPDIFPPDVLMVLDSIKPSFSQFFQHTDIEKERGSYQADSAQVFFFTPLNFPFDPGLYLDAVIWAEGMGSLDGILAAGANYYFEVETGCIHKGDTAYYHPNIWFYSDTCFLEAVSIDNDLESQYSISLGQDREREMIFLSIDPAPIQEISLEIIDISGQKVHQGNLGALEAELQINLHSYPPGVYILRLYSGNSYYHKKIIK
ncbi:MAG: T9SS type A sorting domain-containing protein [Bacteroidia bacterium]|nr:T9SS type A sorting domain-containing protein [Bacteroidia bacterium]